MKTLLIILIILMIVQTTLYIVVSFKDRYKEKQATDASEMWKDAQKGFVLERERLQKICEDKDHVINEWIKRCNNLHDDLTVLKRTNGLLQNHVGDLENLEESLNPQKEYEWDSISAFFDTHQSKKQCFAEGFRLSAEWLCRKLKINAVFELDDRFKEEGN